MLFHFSRIRIQNKLFRIQLVPDLQHCIIVLFLMPEEKLISLEEKELIP